MTSPREQWVSEKKITDGKLKIQVQVDILSLCQSQFMQVYVDGLAQDCSNSIANALELLQSCAKPSMCSMPNKMCTVYFDVVMSEL